MKTERGTQQNYERLQMVGIGVTMAATSNGTEGKRFKEVDWNGQGQVLSEKLKNFSASIQNEGKKMLKNFSYKHLISRMEAD